jgi:hypothetical protein
MAFAQHSAELAHRKLELCGRTAPVAKLVGKWVAPLRRAGFHHPPNRRAVPDRDPIGFRQVIRRRGKALPAIGVER